MDDRRFDAFAKQLAASRSRRTILKVLATASTGGLVTRLARHRAGAQGCNLCILDEVCCPGAGCVNLGTRQNCSGCGDLCLPDQFCIDRSCQCDYGYELCDGRCVYVQADANNCGACGRRCPSGASCSGFECKCGFQEMCDDVCVDTSSDPEHCGSCDGRCDEGQTCEFGSCVGGETEATATPTTATPRPTPTPKPTGIDGTTYTSPTWGFSLEWDGAVWQPTQNLELINNGFDRVDRVWLGNGVTILFVQGAASFGGDPVACRQGQFDLLTGSAEDINQAEANGTPIGGEDEESAYGVYTYTSTRGGEPGKWATYIDCRILVPGEAVVIIVQNSPLADFNDQAALVQEVVATLTLPETVAVELIDPRPTSTPEVDVDLADPRAGAMPDSDSRLDYLAPKPTATPTR